MNKLIRISALMLLVSLVVTPAAWAQVTATWIADGTNGYNVSTAANWDSAAVPTTGDTVYINNGTTALIDAGNTFAGDIGAWYLGSGTGNSGNITQTGGDVTTTDWFRMGHQTGNDVTDPTSVYNMSGGSTTIGVLTVIGLTGKAELNLSGGDAGTPGAAWTSLNRVYVGDTRGTGTLTMADYSSMTTPYMSIGKSAGNLGTVTMTGHASLSSVIPTNSSGYFYLGTGAATDTLGPGTGSISMADDTTATIASNRLLFGDGGNGSMTLSGNAVLTNNQYQRWTTDEEPVAREDSYTYIGNGLDAVATLTMSGHSTMTSSNDNSDGWRGQFWVGRSYSTGTVDLSGGTGYDEATRGAKLVTTNMSDFGSYGRVNEDETVDQGVGNLYVREYAQFETAGLVMGDNGIGNLLIEGHGQVTVTDGQWMRLGFFSMGTVNAELRDSAILTVTGDLLVGDNQGSATFTMGTGTTVTASHVEAGKSNATGTIVMTGGSMTSAGAARISSGAGGTGTLTMSGDASFSSTNSWVGIGNSYGGGGSAQASLCDQATITSAGSILVGWGGTGVLTIGDGTDTDTALVSSGDALQLGHGTSHEDSSATVNLNAGGTLETAYVYTTHQADNPNTTEVDESAAGTLDSIINFNGGILRATASDIPAGTGDPSYPMIPFISNDEWLKITYDTSTPPVATGWGWQGGSQNFQLNVMAGGAIIDTQGYTDTITESLLAGEAEDGGLTKLGTGELILTADTHTYTGETVVEAGTLTTTSNTTFSDTGSLSVAAGALVNLDFTGIADTVMGLYLDGVAMDLGTWGSSSSGATFQNDTYFTGTGTILVVASNEIPGDTNGDSIVDETDATVVAGNWGETEITGGAAEGDFNGDGVVNATDASIMAANWGNHNTGTGEGNSVPEPSTIMLLLAGIAMMVVHRRR